MQEGKQAGVCPQIYEAVTIPGTVTRLVPARNDTLENKIYYEFLDFYKLSKINNVQFYPAGRLCKAADAGLQGRQRGMVG